MPKGPNPPMPPGPPPASTVIANQGTPNTPDNAWPVTVTNFPASQNVNVTNTSSIPVKNVVDTHVLQPPSSLVTLLGNNYTTSSEQITSFQRIFPDGSTTAFSLGTNQVLVITDIQFSYFQSLGGNTFHVVSTPQDLNLSSISTTSNSTGFGSGTISYTTGIETSNFYVRIEGGTLFEVTIQGYVIDYS